MRGHLLTLGAMSVLGAVLGGLAASNETQTASVPRYSLFEVAITDAREYTNPFADVTLRATLSAPSGRATAVEGFYDGHDAWRLRFMPDEVGRWRYEARFSDGSPGRSGGFTCTRGSLHGPLRVCRANPLWFEHADGSPFLLRACHLWSIDALDETTLEKTLDFLTAQGFNAVVGPHLVSPRLPWPGNGEGKPDFSKLNLETWQNLDRVLRMMGQRGMVLIPFSVFGGTNGMPRIPTWKDQDLFLRYWVARWGGFWNATFQPTSEWEEGYSEEEIQRIGGRLDELDGGRHLVSVHALRAGSEQVQRASWYGYHTVQDKLTDWNAMEYTWLVDLHRQGPKPILAHECLWEGNFYQERAGIEVDNLRRAAWVIALCGGQINYADEIVEPGRWMRREDWGLGRTFAERGGAVAPLGQFYRHLKIVGDFTQALPFWRMTPQPELSSTGVCLAEAGRVYAAYAPEGGEVELDLTGAKGRLRGRWFDPRGGERGQGFAVAGGERQSFQAPDGNDWVLLVRR